eukprot:m.414933 g.414933  ORF g.414933 m.414933 type:complete len:386 (-) comp29473_c0_seq1:271-1428(-)
MASVRSVDCGVALVVAMMTVARVAGHASVIMPPSRNAVDGVMPGTPWSGGKHPPIGWIMPYSSWCTNGTSGCNLGQAAFWFSQGCGIGCKVCNGNGSRIPNADHCPDLPKPVSKDVLLDARYRTTNQHTVYGSEEDFYRFNPWRAPGNSPVYDPCGMAGGSTIHRFNAGEYNTTLYAKQGDLGSKVLKPRPSGTIWTRGQVARVRWQQSANHGGGYQFRLCPASEPLTEACFQKHPLQFASEIHTVRYADPSKDVQINATVVKVGGGKGWMRWPYPNYDEGQCDYVLPPGEHCGDRCPGCVAPWYLADAACPCSCDKQYPGLPPGNTLPKDFPQQVTGNPNGDFVIEDTLVVPLGVPAGEYVLGWRWDAEMTSQIWQSCSDITIV